jgi:hypothetical protein
VWLEGLLAAILEPRMRCLVACGLSGDSAVWPVCRVPGVLRGRSAELLAGLLAIML